MLVKGPRIWALSEAERQRRRIEEARWRKAEYQRLSRQAESTPDAERRKLAAQDRAREEWSAGLKDQYI
jgi:hypothetical protein